MDKLFGGIYKGKKVLVTGHTGFKGSWLVLWLHKMGAEVQGYSLPAPTSPSHWELLKLPVKSIEGDIRDREKLNKAFLDFNPDIVFHLAAQPLVRDSYTRTAETYETNVIGSLNVYEAARACSNVKAVVAITTDKVYENKEWIWGYRENDALGGHDPYSASKACMEILSASYRESFWPLSEFGKRHQVLLATARAGNVIGGGDWAKDRLIPDIMKAAAENKITPVRSPKSVRPWQHVLEPLSGYLLLGQKLLEKKVEFAQAFNFGPRDEDNLCVEDLAKHATKLWNKARFEITPIANNPMKEMNLLKLDSAKAQHMLDWRATWDVKTTLEKTIRWYQCFYEEGKILSDEQLSFFIQ